MSDWDAPKTRIAEFETAEKIIEDNKLNDWEYICGRELPGGEERIEFYLLPNGKVINAYTYYDMNPEIAPLKWKIKNWFKKLIEVRN